jgi:predicted deacylase
MPQEGALVCALGIGSWQGGYMTRLIQFTLFTIVLFGTSGFQPAGQFDANDPQLSRFSVAPASEPTMKAISEKFEVEARDGNRYSVIVPAHRTAELYQLAPDAKLLEADLSEEARRAMQEWGRGYHDFEAVEQHLSKITTEHPSMTKLEVYGKSKEGRPLYALRVATRNNQPAILITAATHGNEIITVEVLFGILDSLLAGYSNSSRAKQIIDSHTIYFLPVVNPDGYVRQQRYANGVDPNRDYPYPDKPNRTPNECISAVMSFFHAHNIRGSIDFHSYGKLLMFPWAYTEDAPDRQDEQAFQAVTAHMAKANQYRAGQISKILYAAPGSSADYYFWKNRTLALGIEIGGSHAPNPSQIPANVQANLESTLRFLETVRR